MHRKPLGLVRAVAQQAGLPSPTGSAFPPTGSLHRDDRAMIAYLHRFRCGFDAIDASSLCPGDVSASLRLPVHHSGPLPWRKHLSLPGPCRHAHVALNAA